MDSLACPDKRPTPFGNELARGTALRRELSLLFLKKKKKKIKTNPGIGASLVGRTLAGPRVCFSLFF